MLAPSLAPIGWHRFLSSRKGWDGIAWLSGSLPDHKPFWHPFHQKDSWARSSTRKDDLWGFQHDARARGARRAKKILGHRASLSETVYNSPTPQTCMSDVWPRSPTLTLPDHGDHNGRSNEVCGGALESGLGHTDRQSTRGALPASEPIHCSPLWTLFYASRQHSCTTTRNIGHVCWGQGMCWRHKHRATVEGGWQCLCKTRPRRRISSTDVDASRATPWFCPC